MSYRGIAHLRRSRTLSPYVGGNYATSALSDVTPTYTATPVVIGVNASGQTTYDGVTADQLQVSTPTGKVRDQRDGANNCSSAANLMAKLAGKTCYRDPVTNKETISKASPSMQPPTSVIATLPPGYNTAGMFGSLLPWLLMGGVGLVVVLAMKKKKKSASATTPTITTSLEK